MTEADNLAEAVASCQNDIVQALVREKLAAGVAATEIVTECNRGMSLLGERFASGECFIPELMFGGMVMKQVMAQVGPELDKSQVGEPIGTAVIGTVQYDVHDIGKDILIMMLRGVGFEVVDLGVDTPPDKFADAIREHKPAVVGLSLLLTTCFKSVTATIEAIEQAGLRDGLSIMLGGAAASELLRENTRCDFYGKTAVDGMKYACSVVGATP